MTLAGGFTGVYKALGFDPKHLRRGSSTLMLVISYVKFISNSYNITFFFNFFVNSLTRVLSVQVASYYKKCSLCFPIGLCQVCGKFELQCEQQALM